MIISRLVLTFAAGLLLHLIGGAETARAEKRLAFLVGINDYEKFPPLANPHRDVATLAGALSKIGFDVTAERDLDLRGYYTAFGRFLDKVSAGDIVLVFFAGHGVGLQTGNYLIPRDAPLTDVEQTLKKLSISEFDLIKGVQERGAKLTMVVLDSCRDNPIAELAKRSGRRSGLLAQGLTQPERVDGVVSIYSAGIGQQALDHLGPGDPVKNSVFMRVFARRIVDPISLGDMVALVQQEVSQLALTARGPDGRPSPHRQNPASYNQTSGGLIFLAGRPAEAPKSVVEQPQTKTAAIASPPVQSAPPAPRRYRVVNVRADDVLHVRAAGSANAPAVGRLAPDEQNIEVLEGSARWWRIRKDKLEGWVNNSYVTEMTASGAQRFETFNNQAFQYSNEIAKTVSGLDACTNLCRESQNCAALTYFRSRNLCRLMTRSDALLEANADAISQRMAPR